MSKTNVDAIWAEYQERVDAITAKTVKNKLGELPESAQDEINLAGRSRDASLSLEALDMKCIIMSSEEELAFNTRVAEDIAKRASSTDFLKNRIEGTSEEIRALVAYKKNHGTIENAIKYFEQTRQMYISKLRDQEYKLRGGKLKRKKETEA